MTAITESPTHAARQPITDVQAWFDALLPDARRTLRALGELLAGVTDSTQKAESAERFTTRFLGVANYGSVVDEERDLSAVSRLTVALTLSELIDQHRRVCEIGPGTHTGPPAWTETEVGDVTYHHPYKLRAGFPAGTLLPQNAVVMQIDTEMSPVDSPHVTAYVAREHQTQARAVLDELMTRAAELNPYRGRVVRASYARGLELRVLDLPTALTRDTVIVDESVWQEVDLGVAAVRDQHEALNAAGLGSRRGILLVGPPGVGKSAISAALGNELVGQFTVIYVEAQAGAELLTRVVEEAQKLGGPVLLVIEDVDLWCRDRNRGNGGGGLSELLQAMDIASDARILTVASTNDAATLDAAAVRTGRFDSIVEVGYPTRTDAARILTALIAGLPGGEAVDTAAVASRLPDRTSGSDVREIVRRAVLSAEGGELSTLALLAEVGSGRYQAKIPGSGTYL